MQTWCTDECEACASNSECVALVSCMSACTTNACKKSCWNDHPDGQDDAEKLAAADGCLDEHCQGSCPAAPDPSGCSISAVSRSTPTNGSVWLAVGLAIAWLARRPVGKTTVARERTPNS
jgi:hypothetical protein